MRGEQDFCMSLCSKMRVVGFTKFYPTIFGFVPRLPAVGTFLVGASFEIAPSSVSVSIFIFGTVGSSVADLSATLACPFETSAKQGGIFFIVVFIDSFLQRQSLVSKRKLCSELINCQRVNVIAELVFKLGLSYLILLWEIIQYVDHKVHV